MNTNSLILWKAKQACIKQIKGLACGLYVEHQRRNLKHGLGSLNTRELSQKQFARVLGMKVAK